MSLNKQGVLEKTIELANSLFSGLTACPSGASLSDALKAIYATLYDLNEKTKDN